MSSKSVPIAMAVVRTSTGCVAPIAATRMPKRTSRVFGIGCSTNPATISTFTSVSRSAKNCCRKISTASGEPSVQSSPTTSPRASASSAARRRFPSSVGVTSASGSAAVSRAGLDVLSLSSLLSLRPEGAVMTAGVSSTFLGSDEGIVFLPQAISRSTDKKVSKQL